MAFSIFLLIFPVAVLAQQLHFQAHSQPPKIAIIGAGAAGSSFAYFASSDLPFAQVTVYERDRVGGRTRVIEVPGIGVEEIGATIHVRANRHLANAVKDFGLSLGGSSEDERVGVWDGQEFIFLESDGWWDKLKLLWRYGFSPFKMRALVQSAVTRFLNFYDPAFPAFHNLSEAIKYFKFEEELAFPGLGYVSNHGISAAFAHDLVQTGTRANYMQDLDKIHGLGTLVSLATSGARTVANGSYQIFEEMLKRSRAQTRLGYSVTSISRINASKNEERIQYLVASQNADGTSHEEKYDAVVLAAPLHLANITFHDFPISIPFAPNIAYKQVYITVLKARSILPTVFNTPDLPQMIITTPEANAPFTSLSKRKCNAEECAFRLFSNHEISDRQLDTIFEAVSWVHRHVWDAFPILRPLREPESIQNELNVDVNLDGHECYYANAFEPLISTMETETVASRNIVKILVEKWGAVSQTKTEERDEF
ncbi:uncharacterized protein VTP21DRAFT_8186 [Calcarisporiella thermophila]|uniref:uncharacterized protein n=1 Tax=Calcarisporiella thermophila TaxID=911321 RepID=UPI003744271D